MNYILKKFLGYIVFVMMFCGCVSGFAYNNLDKFMMNYYQKSQSTELIPVLKETLDKNSVQGFQEKLLTHFYAAAINNSDNKDKLLQELTALKVKYSAKSRNIINSIISDVNNFRSPPANSADNFDLLWAEFFATGSEYPVEKIANYLKLENYQQKTEIIYLSAAQWSLAANACRHAKEYAILKNIYALSKGVMRRRLKRILDNPADVAFRFNPRNLPREAPDFDSLKRMIW